MPNDCGPLNAERIFRFVSLFLRDWTSGASIGSFLRAVACSGWGGAAKEGDDKDLLSFFAEDRGWRWGAGVWWLCLKSSCAVAVPCRTTWGCCSSSPFLSNFNKYIITLKLTECYMRSDSGCVNLAPWRTDWRSIWRCRSSSVLQWPI